MEKLLVLGSVINTLVKDDCEWKIIQRVCAAYQVEYNFKYLEVRDGENKYTLSTNNQNIFVRYTIGYNNREDLHYNHKDKTLTHNILENGLCRLTFDKNGRVIEYCNGEQTWNRNCENKITSRTLNETYAPIPLFDCSAEVVEAFNSKFKPRCIAQLRSMLLFTQLIGNDLFNCLYRFI